MDPIIMVENVSFHYPDNNFSMKNLNFSLELCKKYAICGQNGSGKTTLLRLLVGLELVSEGKIIVDNVPLTKRNVKEIYKKVGFVFQNPDSQVFSASVFEDVAFGPRNLGLSRTDVHKIVQVSLQKVGMEDYSERSPYTLSFGQKKRVAIAGVLAMNPSIIILDEPFSNLDYPSRKALMQILDAEIEERKKTIIFATHTRKFIEEWSNNALLLDKGKLIYFGNIKNLRNLPLADELLGPY